MYDPNNVHTSVPNLGKRISRDFIQQGLYTYKVGQTVAGVARVQMLGPCVDQIKRLRWVGQLLNFKYRP